MIGTGVKISLVTRMMLFVFVKDSFKPKAVIKFERVTIGQIIDNEVYFYIRVKPGESKHVCLNYIPELCDRACSAIQVKYDFVVQIYRMCFCGIAT